LLNYFRGLGLSITETLLKEATVNRDDEVWILRGASLHNELR